MLISFVHFQKNEMLELLCIYVQIISKAKIYSMAEMLSKQNMLTDSNQIYLWRFMCFTVDTSFILIMWDAHKHHGVNLFTDK